MWRRTATNANRHWWERRIGGRPQDQLVDNEFDALLSGRYVDWLIQLDEPIPAWAWVNRLAHSTPPDLRALASQPFVSAERAELLQWECVVRSVARFVVTAAADDDSKLCTIQTEVLVPAELSLARRWHSELRPPQLAVLLATAVHDGSWIDNNR